MSQEDRYKYEATRWTTNSTQAKLWFEELESNGPTNVSSRLAQTDASSSGDVKIGETKMTVGFAQEWLAWHDRQKVARQEQQIFWTRWAAISATVAALAAVFATSAAIGWAWTMLR
jgi:hypothetical protein